MNELRKRETTRAACGQAPASTSMLQNLTRHISHNFLPDAVISDNTVEEVPERPSPPTEEPLMTVQLGLDIEEHQKARAAKKEVEQRGGEYVDSDEENSDE